MFSLEPLISIPLGVQWYFIDLGQFWDPRCLPNLSKDISKNMLDFGLFFDRVLIDFGLHFGGPRGTHEPTFGGLVGSWGPDDPQDPPR